MSPKENLWEIIGAGFYSPYAFTVTQPTVSQHYWSELKPPTSTNTNQNCFRDPPTDFL